MLALSNWKHCGEDVALIWLQACRQPEALSCSRSKADESLRTLLWLRRQPQRQEAKVELPWAKNGLFILLEKQRRFCQIFFGGPTVCLNFNKVVAFLGFFDETHFHESIMNLCCPSTSTYRSFEFHFVHNDA